MQNNEFHIVVVIFAVILVFLVGWFSSWGYYFQLAAFVVSIGHWGIAYITGQLHKKARTREYNESGLSNVDCIRILIKNIAGLLELVLYTFFFVFKQIPFVIGWLVIKAVWRYLAKAEERRQYSGSGNGDSECGSREDNSNKDDEESDLVREEAAAGAIFRVGVILSLVVSLMAALLIRHSGFVESSLFDFINEIFE
jgi:hypothetical protein